MCAYEQYVYLKYFNITHYIFQKMSNIYTPPPHTHTCVCVSEIATVLFGPKPSNMAQ